MIDLFITDIAAAEIERLQDAYLALLTPEEAGRAARLRHAGVRAEFLTGRALVRTALSAVTGDAPAAWRFALGDHGKPAIESPSHAGLEFNLSHTHGLIVCAVRRGGAVGVDVENCQRHNGGIDLARRFFAAGEVAALEVAAEEDRRELFFRFWTLKESFIKARGRGLSLPLDRFAFTLAQDKPPRIDFVPDHEASPGDWQFAELICGPEHRIAVCGHEPGRTPLAIRIRESVPLLRMGQPRELPPCQACRWALW